MTAITPVTSGPVGEFFNVRAATAQANTGQTDWIVVPAWAQFAEVFFNITAAAGTTPGPTTISIKSADLKSLNDTNAVTLSAGSAIANTGGQVVDMGPGITGIADAASATRVTINTVLPPLLGLTVLLDRTNTDETYTYNLSVTFRSGSR